MKMLGKKNKDTAANICGMATLVILSISIIIVMKKYQKD
jgi:hypothetical protein